MQKTDFEKFSALLAGVHAFYGKPWTDFAADVWWESCRPYDFAAVKDALNRHAVNPDNGQFLPKPADIVKLIGGGTADGAMVAWSKVEKAIRMVGRYSSVVFDDPIIHAVLNDMGGWIPLGDKSEKELPFVAKEFQTRYAAYRLRGKCESFPRRLPGLIEADRTGQGYPPPDPVMIGDERRARLVFSGGSEQPALQFKTMADAVKTLEAA